MKQTNYSLGECFDIWKGKIHTLIKEHPLQIISWEATRRCNLKCKHCGSPAEDGDIGSELSTSEVIEVFEKIASDFDMKQFRHINITGGEPFVRNDLIDVLKVISKHSVYQNIDIQTNGLFIANNPQIINLLKKYGVTGIGVSIDGLKDSHDSFRNINGGFEKAVEAARLAVEDGLVVTVSVVVHSKNIGELEDLFNFVQSNIRPRVFRLMFLDPIGRTNFDSEYLLTKEQKLMVIRFLQKKYEKECEKYIDSKTMIVELGCGGWFGKELEGTFRPLIFHCIAGINNLGILHDGKISSCSNISRDFVEGDVRIDNIKEVWENRFQRYRNKTWLKKEQCITCNDWDFCHGGPMHLVGLNNNCILKYIALNNG